MFGDFRQCLEAVDCGNDLTTHLFQQGFSAAPNGFTVIYDHDLDIKVGRLLGPCCYLRLGIHVSPKGSSMGIAHFI